MSRKRGSLIVFEGLDRAGKSTQCERLVESLKAEGRAVKHMRFPDRTTPIGRMINDYLKGDVEQEDHVIHLLFSANRWEAASSIRADIEAGITVVIDRYYYSGCVYSAAKDNPSLSIAWARYPEVGLPRPDAVIFLEISPDEAARRGGFGAERYENKRHQDRVREYFKSMRGLPDESEDFKVIDAGGSPDEVADSIWTVVKNTLYAVDNNGLPLRTVQ
ncbi:thymidylate kinase, variant [Verruconis gallopava]|uniref:Thymidylate kinase n=1 Tax=Verruconis gallopava TaxID=253628 RepID=A0A0D2AKL4_9PEZI|nr:thymidylate kinase [Verruconis gallopava]XP_016216974.1 thymidylate kinase, variant [Verruconis gallopava]KIW07104.1 thymidylate kinase [Verruconis gallopava]KIW07105.1 thymidylate kinase, variant [Verruconis gallopava]